jgi:ankyrin repeat domain-containing protein 50
MTVEEIDEASIIKPDAPVAVIDRDRMNPHGLLTLLQGLVNTRLVKEVVTWGDHTLDLEDFFTGRITRHEEEHTELWLSHFSVQEFLTSGRARDEKFKFQKEASHAFISRNCIAYIFYYSSSSQKTGTALDLKLFPLLYYACRFWFEHARLAGASGKVLTSLIINLLQSSTVWEDCLIVCNPQGSRNKNPFSSKVIRRLASPLGWAAVLGLDLVVEELLKNYDRNIDEYQDEAESEFLKRKILAGSSGMDLFDFDGTALMKAAAFGHDKVVRLLIENGAAVNFCPEQSGDTALNVACYQDKEDCVRLLLDNGANINGQQGDNDTALHTVARLDNVKIGQILLELGADPNGPPESDVSPLMNAAWHGSLNMCKLLIENNADINRHSEDPDYPDALAAAASTGDLEVVEFLLSKHAVITDGALYYSLTGAEQEPPERQEVICRLFVEHGANLNPVDETYEIYDRPLALALYNGWNDISKLMIAKGAKIDPDDQSCLNSGNILQAAVLGGSTELVKLLLDKRIDANAPTADVQLYKYWGIEERFATPLQAAAYTLDVDITQILLARNADANSSGPPFGSPLGALAASGRLFYETEITEILEKTEAIYQLLIVNNANLESALTLCKDDRCRWVLGALRKGILRKKLLKHRAERVSAAQQKRGEESHA